MGAAPIPPGRVQRVVFIRTDRLGETLLNLPAVAALQAALPRASVTLLVHPALRDLLSELPGIAQVVADEASPGPWWMRAVRLARWLRRERCDLAVVSNPKKEFHLAAWLAGCRWRVGYDRKWGGLLTHRLQDRKALGERHEVEYNLDLVRAVGWPTASPQWHPPRFLREQAEVERLLQRHGVSPSVPVVAIHPWTSNPIKRWPEERFTALIERTIEGLGARVVVIGGPEEQAGGAGILPDGEAAVDLTGRLTLRQLAALLARARVLVSNDSGPVHLAAAVSTRTVALFGTTDPATGPTRWGPWGTGHVVICRPTMGDISVEEVLAAVRRAYHAEA